MSSAALSRRDGNIFSMCESSATVTTPRRSASVSASIGASGPSSPSKRKQSTIVRAGEVMRHPLADQKTAWVGQVSSRRWLATFNPTSGFPAPGDPETQCSSTDGHGRLPLAPVGRARAHRERCVGPRRSGQLLGHAGRWHQGSPPHVDDGGDRGRRDASPCRRRGRGECLGRSPWAC